MTSLENYLSDNRNRFESDLFEWLRIPSIGTDSAYDQQTREAAEWLAEKFRALELKTELIETCGHPLVYAESPPIEGAPTVLIYGHYDVQPPDPLELWDTPPFEPSVRDGKVYARGATDDKGQMITHLFAVESILKTVGELPVQVKFLIEGEEESSGAGLKAFLEGEYDDKTPVAEKLAADIAVISDCSQFGPGQPAITHGLRGMVHCEIKLTGPARDLHSGCYGGTLNNPANIITSMLTSLINKQGQIQIQGFYDDVLEPTDSERALMNQLEFSESDYADEMGVSEMAGEVGFGTLERRWCRPTFDIHGISSGYSGEGSKTIIPAEASAKFSFRLVPNQDPEKIKRSLQDWLENLCPVGIEMQLELSKGTPGFLIPLDSPYIGAAKRAILRGFGTEPVFVRNGGSLPVVSALSQVPGVDTLLIGWGQDDDNLHSPNEKFSLADFHLGIKTSCFLLNEIASV